MTILWWYWLIAGICLIGLELLIPSFTIIWFGLGALLVGIICYLAPLMPAFAQIVLWAFASICFTVMWFKYLRPKADRTHAGMSKDGIIGETGMIVRGTSDSYDKGIVKFRVSLLGADEWRCYADNTLTAGDNVRVTDMQGQILKVEKI